MFNKIIICILLLLINSTLEIVPIKLETYRSITVSKQSLIYLNLDGFKSGDTIFFEASISSDYKYNDIALGFMETDELDFTSNSYFSKVSSSSYSQIGANAIYYLSYTLKRNNKYLLIITPFFRSYITNFKLSMQRVIM